MPRLRVDEEKLRRAESLVRGGSRIRDACREAGISVVTYYKYVKYRHRDRIAEAIAQYYPLRKKMTYREISERTRISPSTIRRWFARLDNRGGGK